MEATSNWKQVGNDVLLYQGVHLVGKGNIVSTDPNKICHGVKLGNDRVHVRLLEVYDNQLEWDHTERLVDMIGSFLMWATSDVHPMDEATVVVDGSNTSTEDTPNLSNDDPSISPTSFPRDIWIGMTVKVVDENGVIFAVGIIHVTNHEMKLFGIQLGDTHLGIAVDDFLDIATEENKHLKDQMLPWPLERLFATNGRSLEYHSKHNSGSSLDGSSQKRSYMFKTRKRKVESKVLNKMEKSLSREDVLLLNSKTCCMQHCCQYFDRDLAMTIRQKYWEKNFQKRKEYEINVIRNVVELETGESVSVVEGKAIYLEAWRLLHSRGKSQFLELKKRVFGGLIDSSHGNLGKKRMTKKVSQAYSSMKVIIEESADHHPSKLRTTSDNSHQVMRELPTSLTWEGIQNKINDINVSAGCDPISQPTISLLRRTHFKEVVIHKKGNNFSKCTISSALKEHRSHWSGGKEEMQSLRRDEEAHHEEHTQGRLLYHLWRTQSIRRPKEVLCIIHDKMDHCKTTIPRMLFCPKSLDGAMKLPITLTGILTHGHGPKAIAQYNVGVWPSDPNAMIGSLDSILRMLEKVPESAIKTLFEGPDSTDLFHKLLYGSGEVLEGQVRKAFHEDLTFISNLDTSHSPSSSRKYKSLPRRLKLQLDNYVGDNKNRYGFAYFSLLTAMEVFEDIEIGFLMVGHTHEDVDAMFGNFSECLLHHPASSLLDLMGLLMTSRKPNPVPHFIQEVPDFKTFLDPYMLKGSDSLVGHSTPRLFRFYVREDKMPCMQYKIKTTDLDWLPEDGIEMWAWKDDGRPNLPVGSLKRLPMSQIKMLGEVVEGIDKYIGFYRLVHSKIADAKKPAYEKLIQYWEDVLHVLKNDDIKYRLEDGDELVHGFWPVSRWKDLIPSEFLSPACELDPPLNYVGPQRHRPCQAFNPRNDIAKGHIILQRPDTEDLNTYPVFLGVVVSDGVLEGGVNAQNKKEHVCDVKWYRPHKAERRGHLNECGAQERWNNCWKSKWERDPGYPDAERISVNSVVWCYKPRRTAQIGYITIPKSHANKAQDNLNRCFEAKALDRRISAL